MLRYLQTGRRPEGMPQALTILFEKQAYYPVFLHAAIDQDRPLGDAKTFEEHSHDLYHIVLYTHSSGSYLKCGRKHRAEPGALVLVSPGESHDFVSLRRSSMYSEMTFAFKSQTGKVLKIPLENVLTLYTGVVGRLNTEPRLSKDITQELAISMIQIVDYLQSPSPMSDFYAHRALANLFDIVVAHCYTEIIPAADPGQDHSILRVKQYIDEHYSEPISAEDLASISHRSKGHLFRTFKKCFNVSPLAYQQNLRFEAALRLLRFTPLRCYEVAQRVGYSNVYYFHRQFKKRMGITPKRYRLSMR